MSEYDRHPLPPEAMVGCLWDRPHAEGRLINATPLWLDPADAELCEPSGLIPDDTPTTRDVSGPRDGGRKS